jgi:hypothetical protein
MANSNEYMAEYMKRRYHQRHDFAIQKLGGKCAQCGSRENLQIDHKDPSKKTMTVARMTMVSEERFLDELEQCQLLCGGEEGCHTKKTVAERGLKWARGTHGTLSSYRYCKCGLCRAAWNVNSKKYKRRRAKKI